MAPAFSVSARVWYPSSVQPLLLLVGCLCCFSLWLPVLSSWNAHRWSVVAAHAQALLVNPMCKKFCPQHSRSLWAAPVCRCRYFCRLHNNVEFTQAHPNRDETSSQSQVCNSHNVFYCHYLSSVMRVLARMLYYTNLQSYENSYCVLSPAILI